MESAGAVEALIAFAGTLVVLAVWIMILVVIPGFLALYFARLFPLTGQWRKRFNERFGRKLK